MEFLYHQSVTKEIIFCEKRFRTIRLGLNAFERLCEVQFNPLAPKQVIAPAKLHRISHNDVWTMWKVELVVPNAGLRPNQYPRMWFAVKGSIIVFLCIATHVDNYSDAEMEKTARSRVTEFF